MVAACALVPRFSRAARLPWHSDAQMSSRRLALTTAAFLALGAAPAAAQDPASEAVAGAAGYELKRGIATQKMRYYAPAQEVVLRGRVKPAVAGEVLTLYAIRGKNASKQVRRKVRSGGRFEFRFKVGKPGVVRLVIKHRASAAQRAFRTHPADHRGRLAGRRRGARAEGAAAPAGAAARGLRRAGHRLLRRRHVAGPCSPSARPTGSAAMATSRPVVEPGAVGVE